MSKVSENRLLMRIKKNEVNILRNRGYDIANAKLYDVNGEDYSLTRNPFLKPSIDMDIFREIEDTDFRSRQDLSMVYSKDIRGKTHRVVVIYVEENKGGKVVGKEKIGAVTEAIIAGESEHDYHEIILITPYGVSNQVRADLENLDFKTTFLVDDDLMVDLFSHAAAPVSFKTWESERRILGYDNPLPADHHIKEFIKEEGINPKDLVQIRDTDPFIQRLGLEVGDIIMVEIPTPGRNSGDTHVEYRVVVTSLAK